MFDFNRLKDTVLRDKYIIYLNHIGIETETIIKNIRTNVEINGHVLDNTFSNRSYKMLSPNIFLEEIIFKEVNKYLYQHYHESVILDKYLEIDTKSLIATKNSIIERPKIKKPSEIEEGFNKNLEVENNFIRIARFENEMLEESRGLGRTGQAIVFEGIIPFKVDIHPFSEEEPSYTIWDNYEPRNIIGFCKNFNSIESNSILWLNSYILDLLELELDDFNNGLRALNSDNEVILEFRQWRDKLIGNGASFVGQDSNIAKLEGCDLLLRKDYFDKLNSLIPEMVFYTKRLDIIMSPEKQTT